MPLTGYLKIPEIPGESTRADHEDEIDISDIVWDIARESGAGRGSGRARGRAEAADFEFTKHYDAASPYLAQACSTGKRFEEITFSVRQDSGDAPFDYLVITLTNCIVTSYAMAGDDRLDASGILENVAIASEKVDILYTVQADDHSAGDQHEVQLDISAATGR